MPPTVGSTNVRYGLFRAVSLVTLLLASYGGEATLFAQNANRQSPLGATSNDSIKEELKSISCMRPNFIRRAWYHVRFRQELLEARDSIDIGSLKLSELSGVDVWVVGTVKLARARLPIVCLQYPLKNTGSIRKATVDLMHMRGSIEQLRMRAVFVSKQGTAKRLDRLILEPQQLMIRASGIHGMQSNGFGEPAEVSAKVATITNTSAIHSHRDNLASSWSTVGTLEIKANNITLGDIADNASMPPGVVREVKSSSQPRNEATWRYQLSTDEPHWLEGERVAQGLQNGLDFGSLKVQHLNDAKVRLDGAHIVGERLFARVALFYSKSGTTGTSPATAQLDTLGGTVSSLALKGLFAASNPVESSEEINSIVETGNLNLTVEDISGAQPVGYGGTVRINVPSSQIVNGTSIQTRVLESSKERISTGILEIAGENLKAPDLAMSFAGENNQTVLKVGFSMPGPFSWQYDLGKRQASWRSGDLRIANLLLSFEPKRLVDFGGASLTIADLKAEKGRISFSKAGDGLGIELEGLTLNADSIDYRKGVLRGHVAAPFIIGTLSATAAFRDVEHFDLKDIRLSNLSMKITGLDYTQRQQSTNVPRLVVHSEYLNLNVQKYFEMSLPGAPGQLETDVVADLRLGKTTIPSIENPSIKADDI